MRGSLHLRCIRCGAEQPLQPVVDGCPACRDVRANLRVVYPENAGARWSRVGQERRAGIWRFASMLPVSAAPALSLGEGNTPLLAAQRLAARLGLRRLYLKDESRNPTGSYKDRLSAVAIAAARNLGADVLATSSSGNAGASLAGYAARAGLPCIVVSFAGTAGPMLQQIHKLGAVVAPLERKQDRWPVLSYGVEHLGWFATSPRRAPAVGSHPLGVEAYKTLAYEIVEDLDGQVPDWLVMPVCYGDALAGAWYGFQELREAGVIDRLPRLVAAEVFGSLGAALLDGGDGVPDMPAPFAAFAASVGATQSTYQALRALRDSGGAAVSIGNDGLIEAQERLAVTEGVFAELTAAMPILAIERLIAQRRIRPADTVVALITSGGLKDLDRSLAGAEPLPPLDADPASIAQRLAHRLREVPAASGRGLNNQQGERTMNRRSFLVDGAALGAASLIVGRTRFAYAAYPEKPVTFIVPFAAGGGGDMLTRVIADHARNKRNVAAAVEFKPGAGATLGPAHVSRAAPDGGTLGLYSISPFLTVPHLQKVPYDPTKDFTYIAAHAYIPLAVYLTTESQFQDWPGLVKFAKDNPSRLRWGTSGVRGAAHIAVEAAFKKEGVRTTFVPFTGGSEAITALLGGHIEAVVSADYGPQLAAGKVRLLALTGEEKLAAFPKLPTFKELGYPLSTEAIYGIYGPAGLSREIVAYWEQAVKEMMTTEEYRTTLKTANAGAVYMNSAQFTASVVDNYRKLGQSIEQLGFKAK